MNIRTAKLNDCLIVYQLLGDLRDGVKIDYEDFQFFFNSLIETGSSTILIAELDNQISGLVTFSRIPIPRFAGWYYIFEELVVHKDFRNKGVVFYLLNEMIKYLKQDKQAIKVVGIFNGEIQSKIYSRYFENVDKIVIQKMLNPK